LQNSNLTSANLTGADIGLSNFQYTNLTNAVLSESHSYGTFFVDTILDGANFDKANLLFANFDKTSDVNLDGGLDTLDLVPSVNMILEN